MTPKAENKSRHRLWPHVLGVVACLVASPASAQETWDCAFPNHFSPEKFEIVHFAVDGDSLKERDYGLDYRILQNNEYSIVAAWSMSKIWSGNKAPRMGAAVVVIDKATGDYRRSEVYVGEPGDSSVYGNCKRN
jgi:hypothetical protein